MPLFLYLWFRTLLAMNPHFPAFKRIITNPVLFKFFVFQKLSSAFWAGLSIKHFDEKSCGVRVKLSWFNQNPFRSMYFAVEAMAAVRMQALESYNWSMVCAIMGIIPFNCIGLLSKW